ncbi:MAG: PrsW family intramembrane metalloprotease [Candidatus Niyogibacteria bacterium]|nr:PrsW family intramembrane metalloprotease [Candidatus Niyogibacteria bacterium]
MAQVIENPIAALWSAAGGLIVSLFWLWFWLREDPHPEPRRILLLSFVSGGVMVFAALVFEQFVFNVGRDIGLWSASGKPVFLLIFSWAAIEEILKYAASYWSALRKPFFDEPVDAPIYLIASALGFAALENILMLFSLFQAQLSSGLAGTSLRFVGATLLHILASAIVGFSISHDFFHPEHRRRNVIGGLILAILLHAFFNFFILKGGADGLVYVFSVVWLGIIILILSFEKIKSQKPA